MWTSKISILWEQSIEGSFKNIASSSRCLHKVRRRILRCQWQKRESRSYGPMKTSTRRSKACSQCMKMVRVCLSTLCRTWNTSTTRLTAIRRRRILSISHWTFLPCSTVSLLLRQIPIAKDLTPWLKRLCSRSTEPWSSRTARLQNLWANLRAACQTLLRRILRCSLPLLLRSISRRVKTLWARISPQCCFPNSTSGILTWTWRARCAARSLSRRPPRTWPPSSKREDRAWQCRTTVTLRSAISSLSCRQRLAQLQRRTKGKDQASHRASPSA